MRTELIEFWGGPFDGEKREIHPAMNSRLRVHRDESKTPCAVYQYEPASQRYVFTGMDYD